MKTKDLITQDHERMGNRWKTQLKQNLTDQTEDAKLNVMHMRLGTVKIKQEVTSTQRVT